VQALGRTYSTPPDVPADRIEALRSAFMKTMADPEFLADAEKTGIDILPMDGATVQKLWAEYAATPAPLVEKAKVMVAP
jgi:tripartite-type tricarboxylate transporter receptor subunit TctC